MQALDFDNRRHNLPGYPYPSYNLVSGNVVDYDSEERSQRLGAPEEPGPEELRNSMDLVAQVSASVITQKRP